MAFMDRATSLQNYVNIQYGDMKPESVWTLFDDSASQVSLRQVDSRTDVSCSRQEMSSARSNNVEELDDQLLMVLNYRYYEMDLKTIYLNKSYLPKTHSDKSVHREGVMRNIIYDDYAETSARSHLTDPLTKNDLPNVNSNIEVIYFREFSKWNRFCRFWRNLLSLKFCRRS